MCRVLVGVTGFRAKNTEKQRIHRVSTSGLEAGKRKLSGVPDAKYNLCKVGVVIGRLRTPREYSLFKPQQ